MLKILFKAFKPLINRYATNFFHEKDIFKKQESLLKEKIGKLSRCNIGKKMGVQRSSSIENIPLTGYDFYLPFFNNPTDGDFIYNLDDYVRAQTSGSMGKPKKYLLPLTGFKENVKKSALSFLYIVTHDGERSRLEYGDVLYVNIPGGNFLAAFLADTFKNSQSRFFKIVPDTMHQMTFQEKVDYFIKNHSEIDIAYMTITTFLDEICPHTEDPIHLKGLFSQDLSAIPLQEEIKKKSGNYPKTIYAATETYLTGLPSIEYPGGFFFDWRNIYPEFISDENAVDSKIDSFDDFPEIIPMMDVDVGKRYQLIVTPFYNDLTRYVMPDILECISKGDNILNADIPIFKYYTRSDKLLVLHNFTRINEEELITVLKNSEIPFVDFTARRELEGSREYLSIYIELNKKMSKEEIFNRLNNSLLEFDKDWRDLSNFMKYIPLKVNILAKDTFKNYLHKKEGMARVIRIGMRGERFKQLMNS